MASKDFNLDHLTDLANIKLRKDREEKLNKDLKEILDYVEKLQDQNKKTDGTSINLFSGKKSVRKDVLPNDLEVKNSQKALIKGQIPNTQGDYFVIPQVLKR